MSTEHSVNRILSDPVGATLKRLTLPTTLGLIAILTFNLVDSYFISLLGTAELAAVSFTFPVSMVLMNLTLGLSIAVTNNVAKSLGAGDSSQAKIISSYGLLLAIAIVLICSFSLILVSDELFKLLGADANTLPLVRAYMDVWLAGAVMLVIPMVGNGAIRAAGDTASPSIVMSIAGLVNGILDPLLIFGIGPFPELGIQGAAYATILSWLFASLAAGWLLIYKKRLITCTRLSMEQLLSLWRRLLNMAIPASLTNMLGPVAHGVITAMVAQYGNHAVAAYGVGSRIEPVALVVALALSATLSPVIGQNHGARNGERVRESILISLRFTTYWHLLVYGVLALLAGPIAWLFTEDPEVAAVIREFVWIVTASYFAAGSIMMISAALNSLQRPQQSLYYNMIRLLVIYIPLAYLGSLLGGIRGIFVCIGLANVLVMGLGIYWLLRVHRIEYGPSPAALIRG